MASFINMFTSSLIQEEEEKSLIQATVWKSGWCINNAIENGIRARII